MIRHRRRRFDMLAKWHRAVAGCAVLCTLMSAGASADLMTWNSTSVAGNAQALEDWLAAIGIAEEEVDHLIDFETGFTDGQNISGVEDLFPGGLVIRDTSSANSVTIRSSSSYFGGSNPVGQFSISHNEQPYLELDFSASPVDYVSFQDIDQAGTTIVVDLADESTVSFGIETTATGGDQRRVRGHLPQ